MSARVYKEYDQCPICGDPLFINKKDVSKLKCDCCGFSVDIKTEVKEEDHERLKQASDALRSYEFDRAEDRYNLILEDNKANSVVYLMALFGKLLSSFGVVYIKDFNGEAIPTFSEYDPDTPSIKDTDIYKAIVNTKVDASIKKPYLDMINALDKVYKRIDKEINEKKTYDFFICTKISRKTSSNPNADGLTIDSSYASRFYDYLVKSGYKVFYSDKCCNEIEYDSQILSALLKSEKMLVIATQNEYLESSWVQSEWRRWLNFINCGKKSRDSLILCFPTFGVKKFELPRVLRKVQRYTSEIEVLSSLTAKKESPKEEVKTAKVEVKTSVKETPKAVKKVVRSRSGEKKSPEEYFMLAESYYNGDGVEQNYELAIKYYTLAAEAGDIDAQFALGLAYGVGEGCKVDLKESYKYHKLAADGGHIYAQYELAQCYRNGWGCEKNYVEALKYFELSSKQGYIDATKSLKELKKQISDEEKEKTKVTKTESKETPKVATKATPKKEASKEINIESLTPSELFSIGEGYYFGQSGYSKNRTKALNYYLFAADKGHMEAQYKVGSCYDSGNGCTKNQTKALEYYKMAASQGDLLSIMEVAKYYENGIGCKKSAEEANKFYKLAAAKGNAQAKEKIEAYELNKMDLDEMYQLACNHSEGKNGYEYSSFKAYKYYEFAANKGHMKSQYAMGVCEENGKNPALKRNFKAALKYYKLAADQGHVEAQYKVGHLYQWSFVEDGIKRDYNEAFKYYKLAADQGHNEAKISLMGCYKNGEGCEKDSLKALECLNSISTDDKKWKISNLKSLISGVFRQEGISSDYLYNILEANHDCFTKSEINSMYETLAYKGHPIANFYMGERYSSGIDCQKNPKKAIEFYTRAANKGHMEAQHELAVCYTFGIGCTKDEKQAFKYYKLSADQGNSDAQCCVASDYENGIGCTKDLNEAFKYYKLSADQENSLAQYQLGLCYENGIGCTKDEKQAFKYYKLSTDKSLNLAHYKLALCYENGIGCLKDLNEAFRYYKLAADKGDYFAQYEVAIRYEKGFGVVAKNKKQAIEYYKKAAKAGHGEAQKKLKKMWIFKY